MITTQPAAPSSPPELSHWLADGAARLAATERRLERLEAAPAHNSAGRRALFVMALIVVFAAGYLAGGRSPVHAQPANSSASANNGDSGSLVEDIRDLSTDKLDAEQRFAHVMESLRHKIGLDKDAITQPASLIAVTLHDMKAMLQAVPLMAVDVHRMADEMQDMNSKMAAVPAMARELSHLNHNMTIMTHSINTSIGRVGRLMGWMP